MASTPEAAAQAPTVPNVQLNDGRSIPILAFGTGTASKRQPRSALLSTLKHALLTTGITHIDTAELYGTESTVGLAIREAGIPRSRLFLTTKVGHEITDIRASLEQSLTELGTSYVDLYLLHSPYRAKDDDELRRWWAEMETLRAEGKARSIGVSNFTRAHLEAILSTARVVPANNQIEHHPYLQRSNGEYIRWMQERGIVVSCFKGLAPLTIAKGRGPLDPVIGRITAEHGGVSESEVVLAWQFALGIVVVTTTTKVPRLAEYVRAPQLVLRKEEVEEISRVGRTFHFRQFGTEHFAPDDRS